MRTQKATMTYVKTSEAEQYIRKKVKYIIFLIYLTLTSILIGSERG